MNAVAYRTEGMQRLKMKADIGAFRRAKAITIGN
jgi:hypothetical protein